MSPYGFSCVLMGLYGSSWVLMDPHGSLFVSMGPYGLGLELGLEMWIVHWQCKCYICYSSATFATRVLHSLLETVTFVT